MAPTRAQLRAANAARKRRAIEARKAKIFAKRGAAPPGMVWRKGFTYKTGRLAGKRVAGRWVKKPTRGPRAAPVDFFD